MLRFPVKCDKHLYDLQMIKEEYPDAYPVIIASIFQGTAFIYIAYIVYLWWISLQFCRNFLWELFSSIFLMTKDFTFATHNGLYVFMEFLIVSSNPLIFLKK